MKLGVICDGISDDLAHAVDVMDEFGLDYAELQFVDGVEVGDHTAAQIQVMRRLLSDRGKSVSCLSRHIFAGMTSSDTPGNTLHTKHMDALKRVMAYGLPSGKPISANHVTQKRTDFMGY